MLACAFMLIEQLIVDETKLEGHRISLANYFWLQVVCIMNKNISRSILRGKGQQLYFDVSLLVSLPHMSLSIWQRKPLHWSTFELIHFLHTKSQVLHNCLVCTAPELYHNCSLNLTTTIATFFNTHWIHLFYWWALRPSIIFKCRDVDFVQSRRRGPSFSATEK